MKIRTGDTVCVMKGKDRGKRGSVLRVLPSENRVIVEKVNIITKHVKARRAGTRGQRVQMEAPIHISNVMPLDPKTGKPTRVGYRIEGNEKIRIAKKSGVPISVKKS